MSNIQHIFDGEAGSSAAGKLNAVIDIINNLDEGTGWSPQLALITDGARRVFEIVDWVGGTGTKPQVGQYIGDGGLVNDIAQAIDVRGVEGAQGIQGVQGDKGDKGDKGDQGDQGIQGVQGDKGDKGDQGDDGASGNLLNEVQLGDIDGAVAIDLSQGSTFVGTLTDAITLSFTNVPTGGTGIVLEFDGIHQITFPAGAKAVGGDIPEGTGGRYKYIVTIRAAGDYDIDGIIDNLQSVV